MFEEDSWLINPNRWPRWMRIFEDNPFNIPAIPDVSGHIKAGVRTLHEPVPEYEARLAAEQAAELQGRVEDRLAAQDQARAWEEDSGGLPTRDITSQGSIAKILGVDRENVPAHLGGKPKEKKKKEMDEWEQAFLMSMMENMRGENIGQAPAVVAGGGQRQWPSMMRQFAPWEQQKPYWWIT